MNIEIREYTDFDLEEITGLYRAVGWTNYTARAGMLREAYAHSLCVLGAYLGDRLIGLLRAVGDGVSVVLIQDLLVLPEFQRQGVGKKLLRTVMDRYKTVYQMELLTDDTEKTLRSTAQRVSFPQAKWGACRLSGCSNKTDPPRTFSMRGGCAYYR